MSTNNVTNPSTDPLMNTVLSNLMMNMSNDNMIKGSLGSPDEIDQLYKVNSLQTSISKQPHDISRTSNKIERKKFEYAMVEEHLKKRNKHLFIKDYSKNDYHLFL